MTAAGGERTFASFDLDAAIPGGSPADARGVLPYGFRRSGGSDVIHSGFICGRVSYFRTPIVTRYSRGIASPAGVRYFSCIATKSRSRAADRVRMLPAEQRGMAR